MNHLKQLTAYSHFPLDCDPRIQQVVQVAQLSVQYLLGTKKVLDEKKSVIKGAIDAFDDEEKVLDLKLAKLRYVHTSLYEFV